MSNVIDITKKLKQRENERALRIATRVLRDERLKQHEKAIKRIDSFFDGEPV